MSSLRVVPPSPEQLALADAREFGRIVRRNWEGALLVARSAERAEQGRRSDLAQNEPGKKLSLRRFSDEAECSRNTTALYLDIWDLAAADDLHPPAASLVPGVHVDLSHVDAKMWEHYYSAARSARRGGGVDPLPAEIIRNFAGHRPLGLPPRERHALQFERYQEVMGKLPPSYDERSNAARQFRFTRSCDLPPPALLPDTPYRGDAQARAIMAALDQLQPWELSDWRHFVADLREAADCIESWHSRPVCPELLAALTEVTYHEKAELPPPDLTPEAAAGMLRLPQRQLTAGWQVRPA